MGSFKDKIVFMPYVFLLYFFISLKIPSHQWNLYYIDVGVHLKDYMRVNVVSSNKNVFLFNKKTVRPFQAALLVFITKLVENEPTFGENAPNTFDTKRVESVSLSCSIQPPTLKACRSRCHALSCPIRIKYYKIITGN